MTESAVGVEFARRARNRGDAELNAILAGAPPGVLSLMGGFPNPATFPADALDELVAGLLRDDPAGALQYTPVEGIPSVREFLLDRQEQLQGGRPDPGELIVTSGGMECITLACQALVDPGDAVVVEAPTYLGALMAFAGVEAEVVGIPMDEDGMLVDALEERLAVGFRPKLVYVIPDFQNPSGRTLSLERRRALVAVCRRFGVVVLEDVAYREIAFSDDGAPPTLWSLAPDVVVQAGTFSKIFCPGVRLGWAAGPREVIAQMAAAKQTTDQCAGGLGQRIVEAYGRAGHFERRIPEARALYASHWQAVRVALESHMPAGCRWSEPEGGFFTWLELPGIDTTAMRVAALKAGVAYVPGTPFYPGEGGANELRVSFSYLDEEELEAAVSRLAGVVRTAVAGSGTSTAAG
ncbi:MAG TPA: PLP-dependent aminotransferase family protein [Solirubrobacteraceae bacterium]|jgi:2-aminoadipate transaminase|nr:PLP-dependent aminotransferase family protein [Solirubrobacteraceae bacterium]